MSREWYLYSLILARILNLSLVTRLPGLTFQNLLRVPEKSKLLLTNLDGATTKLYELNQLQPFHNISEFSIGGNIPEESKPYHR